MLVVTRQRLGAGFLALGAMLFAEASAAEPLAGSDTSVNAQELPALPGIHFDPERRFIDVEAKVIGNQVEWLELVACTPKSREHEALVTVLAQPSHIHLALVVIGATPGHPQRRVATEDGHVWEPGTGDELKLFFVLPGDDPSPLPVTEWVMDQRTDAPLTAENRWIFTGSQIVEDGDDRIYLADLNGTVVSLVNFGDDLIARPTSDTNENDGMALTARPAVMPPDGTLVRLRISLDLRASVAPDAPGTAEGPVEHPG